MDQNKTTYSELLTQFTAKATAELIAVVIIVLGDLFFVYKTIPMIQHYKDHVFTFHAILALIQIMVFALCLRIVYEHSVSGLKKRIDHLIQSGEKPRQPE